MKIAQVNKYFIDKENVPCPLTERLVRAGYRQMSGGYINKAKILKIKNPSQYWHLTSYCNSVNKNKTFGKNVECGELIFWMAEVSGAVPEGFAD